MRWKIFSRFQRGVTEPGRRPLLDARLGAPWVTIDPLPTELFPLTRHATAVDRHLDLDSTRFSDHCEKLFSLLAQIFHLSRQGIGAPNHPNRPGAGHGGRFGQVRNTVGHLLRLMGNFFDIPGNLIGGRILIGHGLGNFCGNLIHGADGFGGASDAVTPRWLSFRSIASSS